MLLNPYIDEKLLKKARVIRADDTEIQSFHCREHDGELYINGRRVSDPAPIVTRPGPSLGRQRVWHG